MPRARDESGEDVAVQADSQKMDRAVDKQGVGAGPVKAVDAPRVVAVDGAQPAGCLAVVAPGLVDGRIVRRPRSPPVRKAQRGVGRLLDAENPMVRASG